MLEKWQQMVDEALERTHELLAGLGTGELDEEPDGCAVDFTADATPDEDIDGVVLFAGIDPEDADAVSDRAELWRAIARQTEDGNAS